MTKVRTWFYKSICVTPFAAQSAFVVTPESSSGVQISSWSSLPFVAAAGEAVSYEGDELGLLH